LSFVRTELNGPLARLSLSVVAGVLQSLVPATPGNIGANYLRSVYNCIHDSMDSQKRGTKAAYFDALVLSGECLAELDWWDTSLRKGLTRRSQPDDSSIVTITFGDGSGTGSGGTVEFVGAHGNPTDPSESWMGTWTPLVSGHSSNWRELRTVVEILRMEPLTTSRFRSRRLFYFTDNSTTYDVVRRGSSTSPGLHRLVRELRHLEIAHHCFLEVIHVPGTVIIKQGADGLSRGVWDTPLTVDPSFSTQALFEPFPLTDPLVTWLASVLPKPWVDPTCLLHQPPLLPWRRSRLMHNHCVWSLDPALAREAMTVACLAWAESPLDSSHVFVVPKILQRTFGRVNRHMIFLGQFDPSALFSLSHPCLVPLLIYYLPPFIRTFPIVSDRGVEPPPSGRIPPWITQQVTHLRGLS
jgi:hypothetical protein